MHLSVQARKTKELHSEKSWCYLYFRKWNFLAPNLNNSYIKKALIFPGETCKAWKIKISYICLKRVFRTFQRNFWWSLKKNPLYSRMTANKALKQKANSILCLLQILIQPKCLIFYVSHGNYWSEENPCSSLEKKASGYFTVIFGILNYIFM